MVESDARPVGMGVAVLAACSIVGASAMWASGTTSHSLRRHCLQRGLLYEFALSAACAVLFVSGVSAAWSVAVALMSRWQKGVK